MTGYCNFWLIFISSAFPNVQKMFSPKFYRRRCLSVDRLFKLHPLAHFCFKLHFIPSKKSHPLPPSNGKYLSLRYAWLRLCAHLSTPPRILWRSFACLPQRTLIVDIFYITFAPQHHFTIATRNLQFATRYSELSTRYSEFATLNWLLATLNSLLSTRYSLLASFLLSSRYSQLATCYSLLSARYSQLATRWCACADPFICELEQGLSAT